HSKVFAAERLFHEIGDHATIVKLQTRTIGVEDTHNAHIDSVIAAVRGCHGFRKTFGLVVNRTRADGIYVSPITFVLWMDKRIAIALRSRSKKKRTRIVARKLQQIQNTDRAHLQRLDAILHVIFRTRRRGEIKDEIHLAGIEDLTDILLQELKSRFAVELCEIARVAGEKIVNAKNRMSLADQRIAQMR